MVWTYRAQHRRDCRSMQPEYGCTEKIWQAKEIMGWSAWEWQKEAGYGFCWPSKSFLVERTPSRKSYQKAQASVEENRSLKWIWWCMPVVSVFSDILVTFFKVNKLFSLKTCKSSIFSTLIIVYPLYLYCKTPIYYPSMPIYHIKI